MQGAEELVKCYVETPNSKDWVTHILFIEWKTRPSVLQQKKNTFHKSILPVVILVMDNVPADLSSLENDLLEELRVH